MRRTVLVSAAMLGFAAATLGGRAVRAQEAAVEPSVLGDTSRDLLFTPVVPCRIVDTRVAGGPMSNGATRDFKVTGDAHQAQGGSIAGCGVPSGPTSAVLNIVAVGATGAGHLRAWAYSTPPVGPPLAAVLTFAPGLNITNGLPVPMCDPSATTCGFDVRIFAAVGAAGSVDLVIDVVGYFSGKSVTNADVAPGAAIAESKLALNFPTHSAANDPSATEKAALFGTSGAPGAGNRYVTNADPRNHLPANDPTVTEKAALAGTSGAPGGGNRYVTNADPRNHLPANDPSATEKAALAGTFGLPGAGNRYVTNADPRNTDARAPLVHGVGAHNATVISLTGAYAASRSNTTGTTETAMLSVDGRSMCFLTTVQVTDTDESSEYAHCGIRPSSGVWTLYATLGSGLFGIDADVYCEAQCIQW